jgi:hypothetical protein
MMPCEWRTGSGRMACFQLFRPHANVYLPYRELNEQMLVDEFRRNGCFGKLEAEDPNQ